MSIRAQLTTRGKSKVCEHFLTQLNNDISQKKKNTAAAASPAAAYVNY